MEPNHRPGPAPAPQEPPHHRRAQRPPLRRRSKLGMFFTAFGILAFGVSAYEICADSPACMGTSAGRRRRMKRFGNWLAKVVGTAVVIVLVFVLHLTPPGWRESLPDLSGAAITEFATLAREMRASARLETMTVDEQGVITSSTSAFLIGVVQSVAITYDYHASVGIDLSKVQVAASGNTITFRIPAPEVLSDSLTPDYSKSVINDTWYTLTDVRRQQLLDDEQNARRTAVTADQSSSDAAWANTLNVFENYIAKWISLGNSRLEYKFERLTEE